MKRLTMFARWTYSSVLLIALLCGVASCSKYDNPKEEANSMPPIFPDYINVTIPENIAPLNFEVKGAKHIVATISVRGKQEMKLSGESKISFPIKDWRKLLSATAGDKLDVTVDVWTDQNPDGVRYKSFSIYVSKDKIDPWVAYRLIPPGYELWNRMGIFQRNLEDFEQSPIILNSQNNKGCVNCHSFCNYNPKTFLFHARGEGGSTMLTINGQTRKLPIDQIGPKKSATYPYWHPSGNFIAFSSNVTRQSFYGISMNKIEVYDLNSDLIIYDVRNNKVITDKRFCNNADWETFPTFSPDGKYLYLCVAHLGISDAERAKIQSYISQIKYAIIRVPFDTRTGELGSRVDTIFSPYRDGGSGSLPRISPDGHYLMYTWASCATFPIQHKEADLKMIDLRTMKYVDTSILNSKDVDSYHSWSSNGRWIVFSSKRIDGKYTRLYFAHVDKDGRFTRPFMLPQKDPEQNGALLYAYNIPEFIKGKVHLDKDEVAKMFRVN